MSEHDLRSRNTYEGFDMTAVEQTTKQAAKKPAIQRDWWSKTFAGLLLGFTLAVAISGIFVKTNATMAFSIRGQLAKWMMARIWLSTLSGVYLFQSGKKAWLWLCLTNLVAFGVYALTRYI